MLVTYGADQTRESLRQSEDFAAAWQTAGLPCTAWPRPGLNHFDELFGLTDSDGDLTTRILALADG